MPPGFWGGTPPDDHVWVNAVPLHDGYPPTRQLIYWDDEDVVLDLRSDEPLTGKTYEILDGDGNLIETGSAVDPLPLVNARPGLGPYRIHISRATPDPEWGLCAGSAGFTVWRHAEGMPDKPVLEDYSANNYDNNIALRASGIAAVPRLSITDAANPAGAGGPGTIATVSSDADLAAARYPVDAARPMPLFGNFTYYDATAPEDAGVTTAVNALKAKITHWEARNEPDGQAAAVYLPKLEAFRAAVLAADPTAKIIGPCTTSTGGPANSGSFKFLDDFFALGGADAIDEITWHGYNEVNGDLVLARLVCERREAMLRRHGVDGLTRWDTEWGNFGAHFGVIQPKHQARWVMMQYLINEQYGIPKERFGYFYDDSHGFLDYPSWWTAGFAYGTLPVFAMVRVWSEMLIGKVHAKRYNFGAVEESGYLGSRFDGEDGSSVVVLMASGRTDGSVGMWVKGATALTVVDCYGVESLAPVTDGQVEVATANGVPTYVQVPAGATAKPVLRRYGVDLALDATHSSSGSGAGGPKTHDGLLRTWYFLISGDNVADETAPYLNDTASFPMWDAWTWGAPQTFDTVQVLCPPPWQGQGTLLDFDLQRWTGSTWATIETVTEPTRTVPWLSDNRDHECKAVSYFADRSTFQFEFAPITTTALRLLVRDATYGGSPDAVTLAAGGQAGPHKSCIRAFRVYHRAGLPAPKYVRAA